MITTQPLLSLTFSFLWSFSFLCFMFYLLFIFSVIIYLVQNTKNHLASHAFKNFSGFNVVKGFDLLPLLASPLLLILILNFSWTSPMVLSWFSHLIFSNLQIKIIYLIIFFFFFVIIIYCSTFYYSSNEIFDYNLVLYNYFVWTCFLFTSNNLFTFIFFIEILATLVNLLIITSLFSSTYFYNNTTLQKANYFENSLPFSFLQTMIFFFWISLISSLNLFIFLILFYVKFLTFDWFLIESIFMYIITTSNLKALFYLTLIWFNFFFCVLLKCGVVPFFFWKPTFFKGIPTHALMFYVTFFYYFILLYLILVLSTYLSDIFYFNAIINIVAILVSFFMLLTIVLESFYLKTFLAVSSTINTTIVFLALISLGYVDITLLL